MVASRRHEVEDQYLENLKMVARERSALVNVDFRRLGRLDQEVVISCILIIAMDQTGSDLNIGL